MHIYSSLPTFLTERHPYVVPDEIARHLLPKEVEKNINVLTQVHIFPEVYVGILWKSQQSQALTT